MCRVRSLTFILHYYMSYEIVTPIGANDYSIVTTPRIDLLRRRYVPGFPGSMHQTPVEAVTGTGSARRRGGETRWPPVLEAVVVEVFRRR